MSQKLTRGRNKRDPKLCMAFGRQGEAAAISQRHKGPAVTAVALLKPPSFVSISPCCIHCA